MSNKIFKSEEKAFLSKSALFLEEFEPKFVDYFIALCSSYHCSLPSDEKKVIASAIYHNVLRYGAHWEELKDTLFIKMQQDGLMVGFLINRSMFYLLENYLSFAKVHQFAPQIEILMSCITRFIQLFENEITEKTTFQIADFASDSSVALHSNNNIIDIFKKMQQDKKAVRFLNLYQGVPISYDAPILHVEAETVTFSIDRLQEIAMKLDGHAYIIKNEYFTKHIKADILFNDFTNNTVTLHNFIYLLNMPAMQRAYIRVHPDIVANVYLHQFGDIQTSGRLYDLSMKGLGVVSHENNGIFRGAKVMVEFDLNSISGRQGDKIIVESEVINIIEYKDSYRYCMQIFPANEMIDKIAEYILLREKEIIQNLEDELREYIV
ncbi:MAG: PilZ domain-containing protein [Sulfurospirillaceae bacterium]|nr:PilZ domain-containing protein [Sulfurospirillaceae bacterium]